MTQAFNLVAERPQPIRGAYAYMPNVPHTHNNIFYSSTATDTIKAGDFVKLSSTSTNTACPVVEACAVTDVPVGMVVYDCRLNGFKVGEKVALAKTGDIVWLVANGAITVGAKLQMVDGTVYVDDTATADNAYIGVAQTVATAQGDFVQVELNFNLGVGVAPANAD